MAGIQEPAGTDETEDSRASERGTDRRGCVSVFLGVGMILIGIPMLICPGPGAATILAGAGMVAAGLGLRVKKER